MVQVQVSDQALHDQVQVSDRGLYDPELVSVPASVEHWVELLVHGWGSVERWAV